MMNIFFWILELCAFVVCISQASSCWSVSSLMNSSLNMHIRKKELLGKIVYDSLVYLVPISKMIQIYHKVFKKELSLLLFVKLMMIRTLLVSTALTF